LNAPESYKGGKITFVEREIGKGAKEFMPEGLKPLQGKQGKLLGFTKDSGDDLDFTQ
jgi:hypothetical protein